MRNGSRREKRGEMEKEKEVERGGLRSGTVDHGPFLIPPVSGFVLWPSRKWEPGGQTTINKEPRRIQLAINGQP